MMMPIDGSVHEAATIPEVELRYFPPDFEEYIRTEQLNCSLFEGNDSHDFEGNHPRPLGWVFWSQRDPQTQPDNYADLIRHALQKFASKEELYCKLVQFWAPTKTSEGRTLLTTQFQPFALSLTYNIATFSRDRLCEYRMGMCREYNNSFYADAECPQEQLGVPGRVFLHQFPEFAVFVTTHYTLEEYPQHDLALRCGIESSRVVPVFDQSTHACVGVLEIVSPYLLDFALWPEKFFLGQMYEIFQEFGLQCFDGYKHYEMQIRDENKACTVAFQELKTVLEMVCNIHKLPLAMTWVPCSTCNDSLQGQLILKGVEFCRHGNIRMDKASRKKKRSMDMFIEASKWGHLRTGVVARMVRSSSNILYCSDITQLSLVDYPLVPQARNCKFRGWFTIRLQSSYTANNIYVLEFFWPYRGNSENSLSLILGTMVENFRTFKLASGQELGGLLRVEVMKFQKGRKLHSVKNIQATRLSRDHKSVKSVSRDYGIHHQSPRDTDMVGSSRPLLAGFLSLRSSSPWNQEQDPSLNSDLRFDESSASVCNIKRSFQDGNMGFSRDLELVKPVSRDYGIHHGSPRDTDMVGSSRPLLGEDQEQDPSLNSDLRFDETSASVCNIKRSFQDGNMVSSHDLELVKPVSRDYGIHYWSPRDMDMVGPSRPLPGEYQEQDPSLNSDLRCDESTARVCNMVTIKAKVPDYYTIKFSLSLSARFVELQQQVAKRLNHLEAGTYRVFYEDEENERTLIACDEDLQYFLHTSRSLSNTAAVVLLEPNQSDNNLDSTN